VIEHHHSLPPWLEDAPDLVDSGLRARRVMKHSMRIHKIEAVIGQAQLLCILLYEGSVQSQDAEMLLSGRECGVGQVNAGVVGAVERKHGAVSAIARSDFKDPFAARFRERDQKRDVPFRAVTILAKFVVEFLLRTGFRDEMGAASFCVPELVHFLHRRTAIHEGTL
jgi:hypothetical protein